MSENEEPVGPRRVIGTPTPAPVAVDTERAPEKPPIVADPPDMRRAKNAERLVAALFVLAFIAGCGFIAAFVGIEVGGATSGNVVDAVFRSNLALGLSLSVALLAIAAGSINFVRYLTTNFVMEEERQSMASAPADR